MTDKQIEALKLKCERASAKVTVLSARLKIVTKEVLTRTKERDTLKKAIFKINNESADTVFKIQKYDGSLGIPESKLAVKSLNKIYALAHKCMPQDNR